MTVSPLPGYTKRKLIFRVVKCLMVWWIFWNIIFYLSR